MLVIDNLDPALLDAQLGRLRCIFHLFALLDLKLLFIILSLVDVLLLLDLAYLD